MADRPCDCLRLESPLCSCQHCQWFFAGRVAVVIRQRHLQNAYEILVTQYDQFRTGWVTFGEYFTEKGASRTNLCWCQKTRLIAVSCGIKISAVHHLVLSQYTRLTDRRTNRQTDRIATAIPCVALHAVARQNGRAECNGPVSSGNVWEGRRSLSPYEAWGFSRRKICEKVRM